MENLQANITFRQSWNNLIDLPSKVSSLLYNANVSPQDVIIELTPKSKTSVYLGWSGMVSDSVSSIGIDPTSAQPFDLSEKEPVNMSVRIRNAKSPKIMLEPHDFSDWELVELHAAFIESKFIEQSRCVAVNQTLVVFPTKTSSIRFIVKDIGLNEHFALIDPFAEVLIAPKSNSRKVKAGPIAAKELKKPANEFTPQPRILRRGILVSDSLFPNTEISSLSSDYEVFGNPSEMIKVFGICEFVSVSLVLSSETKSGKSINSNPSGQQETTKDTEKGNSRMTTIESRQIVARFIPCISSPKNTIGLSEKMMSALNVDKDSVCKVVLKTAQRSETKAPSTFVIHPIILNGRKLENFGLNKRLRAEFSQEIARNFFPKSRYDSSPISNHSRIPSIPKYLPHGGILVFKKNADPNAWFLFTGSGLSENQKVEIGEPISRNGPEKKQIRPQVEPLYGVDRHIRELADYLGTFKTTGLLIHGTHGSGKSVVMKSLENLMRNYFGTFTEFVNCEALMHETPDQIRLKMANWVHKAIWNGPSVIFLDNLDKILSADIENFDSSVAVSLSEHFVSLLQGVFSKKSSSVSIVLSGVSKESFNGLVTRAHLIDKYFHLRPPMKSTRSEILEGYLSTNLKSEFTFDFMDVVSETEGYLPKDLKILCDRMYFESQSHSSSTSHSNVVNRTAISKTDFKAALRGFKPSSLRGVKLEKGGAHWKDIGGMTEAKRVLLETLEWPTKYAPIFSNCPLRLRSGLLFYGYPGCGKTLLASAIAGKCGMNFISVKGPEILNKYIGASEQSVRELFERAQSAKPCILFFDEFDSIAPKRGHDSTGVTDRVVNQMLTQMDGAEGLDGVYVLAATSRPDLIDSALLRPGRLDKSIFCNLPDYNDRLKILKCICENMDLSQDVQLETIASKTGGFSGADLQGLGYNAYLMAVHDKLSKDEMATTKDAGEDKNHGYFLIDAKTSGAKVRSVRDAIISDQVESLEGNRKVLNEKQDIVNHDQKIHVWITQEHFISSLRESKSSISSSEKTKLHNIYSEFSTGRDGEMLDGSGSSEVGGRVTLM